MDKLQNMLQILSNQIENYSNSNVENINIRILVCNDTIEPYFKKKELLLKEINYSPNHVFLNVLDDVYSYNFVESCIVKLKKKKFKECCCHGL